MTEELFIKHKGIILDASSVINLYATGRMPEIVRVLSIRCMVSTYVKEYEALAIYEQTGEANMRRRTPINLQSMIDDGILENCTHKTSSIMNRIVELARSGVRGMGEKICAAIAVEYDWAVALDDHSATSKLNRLIPGMQTITSLDLLKYWYEQESITISELNEALTNLRWRGNYSIPKRHHLFHWAQEHIEAL